MIVHTAKRHRAIRRSTEDVLVDLFVYVGLAVVFFITAYPFYYGMVMSFNSSLDSSLGGVYFWPRDFTLKNYAAFFNDAKWLTAFFVTVLRTVTGTVITVVFTTVVSYGLSEPKLRLRKLYMMMLVISMYFVPGLIPYYMTIRTLGLPNTFFVYIIPPALNLFFVFISITFFQAVPKELRESGMLDGASEITILFRLILPVSLPLLATTAIFSGVFHWNSWFDSAYFVKDANLRTMGYLLMEVINEASAPTSAQSAMRAAASRISPLSMRVTAMMISVIPILCIYPFLQKYFVTGLTIGAVKG
jgi:putative aldouronate transport system permease protein